MNPKSVLFFLTFLLTLVAQAAPPVEEGKSIFTARCAGCHSVHKILTGPALAGVDQRHTIDWIINFVHSSQTVIKKGDPQAVALFAKFNRIPMPDHPDLSAGQIKNIVEFIKTEAKNGPADKTTAAVREAAEIKPLLPAFTSANAGFYVTLLALAVLLTAVLLFAYKVKQYGRQVRSQA